MTLLLGPPGAGKTTFLLSLAGKLNQNLKKSGKITYCGHEFSEFVPQKTCAYISPQDLHQGEMTVRETLDFSGRCLGVGTRYEMLVELLRHEKVAGIKPDPGIDAFMKGTSILDKNTSLVTDYILKVLGLDVCSDIMVGDDMRRGISGGQIKRVTTGEMLVGAAKALFMDEISTGLDSSTTFQILKCMRQMVHIIDVTMIIALLQPAPETYDLFDDIILLSEGQIVYQGPRENILEFFGYMGFKCPERKGVADFLQEVSSKKDQEQYWFKNDQPYRYISVGDFARAFQSFHIGQKVTEELAVPYDKSKAHTFALVKEKYGISNWELFRACFSREWLLMTRNSFIYVFKTVQITIMAIITFTVFFRTKMPHGSLTILDIGSAHMAIGLYPIHFCSWKNSDDLEPWVEWAYYIFPLSYGQNAPNPDPDSMNLLSGKSFQSRGFYTEDHWFWICICAIIGFSVLFNILFIAALTFLNPLGDSSALILDESASKTNKKSSGKSVLETPEGVAMEQAHTSTGLGLPVGTVDHASKKGMILTFQSLSLVFNHINYYVDVPAEMKGQGFEGDRLQLLHDLSGAFRPGVLTALVGVSGAGKTTLMDVLAGKKTGGYIEGDISISGYPKNQATFARISGYCEQNDIHSPMLPFMNQCYTLLGCAFQ
ncbi:UNVERIFIED_CONTAM: ABC transporter G family member 39 [Sesamum radiatum]|uniref:ABC transporter G family member 39 n=1 Tax=Sesamum radiatum TaxID=300843 RepID=A0AAW2KV04_SESRA